MSRSWLVFEPKIALGGVAAVDVKVIAPIGESIGIKEIRDLIRWAHHKPYHAAEKIALIEEADKLTPEAQNCLLKLLEEPPERTQLVLLARRKQSFLPTVLSRCQLISWPQAQASALAKFISPKTEDQRAAQTSAKEAAEFLSQLRSKDLAAGFKWLEKKNKQLDRSAWLKLLEQSIRILHQKAHASKKYRLLKLAADLEKTRQLIRRQANIRLALENLLLQLQPAENFPRRAV